MIGFGHLTFRVCERCLQVAFEPTAPIHEVDLPHDLVSKFSVPDNKQLLKLVGSPRVIELICFPASNQPSWCHQAEFTFLEHLIQQNTGSLILGLEPREILEIAEFLNLPTIGQPGGRALRIRGLFGKPGLRLEPLRTLSNEEIDKRTNLQSFAIYVGEDIPMTDLDCNSIITIGGVEFQVAFKRLGGIEIELIRKLGRLEP